MVNLPAATASFCRPKRTAAILAELKPTDGFSALTAVPDDWLSFPTSVGMLSAKPRHVRAARCPAGNFSMKIH
jgi:hypothetical protein